ncbi:MAG: DUF1643 domain-containing protein [Cyanobacteria bacterium J06560_2]
MSSTASPTHAAERTTEQVTASIERTAILDRTGNYRYRLGRRWQTTGPEVAFVMLNPSSADATQDDPTLRACIQFAQKWNYASLSVVNLFGYRTPHPSELKKVKDPIGAENDAYVLAAVTAAKKVVLAWGNEGGLLGRDRAILTQLLPHKQKLHYLLLNRSGQPRHPLYVSRSVVPTKFSQPY